jgi:hypothetical protein
LLVHCASVVQAVTQVFVITLHAVPPSPPQLAFERQRTHVLVSGLQYGWAPLQSALVAHSTHVLAALHTGAFAGQLVAERHCTQTRLAVSQ